MVIFHSYVKLPEGKSPYAAKIVSIIKGVISQQTSLGGACHLVQNKFDFVRSSAAAEPRPMTRGQMTHPDTTENSLMGLESSW